jgi:hypothetical protein
MTMRSIKVRRLPPSVLLIAIVAVATAIVDA